MNRLDSFLNHLKEMAYINNHVDELGGIPEENINCRNCVKSRWVMMSSGSDHNPNLTCICLSKGKTVWTPTLSHLTDSTLCDGPLAEEGDDPNERDEAGRTPLFYVKYKSSIYKLIVAGADPNVIDEDGNAPLHRAAERAWPPESLRLLIEAGADPSVRNAQGELPEDIADDEETRDFLRGAREARELAAVAGEGKTEKSDGAGRRRRI